MSLPASWADLIGRFAVLQGCDPARLPGTPEDALVADGYEWIRQAVVATWQVDSLHALDRSLRARAFQRCTSVVLYLEDQPDGVAFDPNAREVIREAFAIYWNGIYLDGPPWRLGPFEERPSFADWQASLRPAWEIAGKES